MSALGGTAPTVPVAARTRRMDSTRSTATLWIAHYPHDFVNKITPLSLDDDRMVVTLSAHLGTKPIDWRVREC